MLSEANLGMFVRQYNATRSVVSTCCAEVLTRVGHFAATTADAITTKIWAVDVDVAKLM